MSIEKLLLVIAEIERSNKESFRSALTEELDQLKAHLSPISGSTFDLVTKDEACKALRISKPTLDKIVKNSGLEYERFRGCRRCYIKLSDLEKKARAV